MIIICGILRTGVVTMGVLHNSWNKCYHDLLDIYAQSQTVIGSKAEGVHIRQIPVYMLQLSLALGIHYAL